MFGIDPLYDPGLSFPLMSPTVINNITYEQLLEVRLAAVSMAVRYGYIMFAIGFVIGALIGIGLYRALISPGFLLRETEPKSSHKDSSYSILADRMGDDEGEQ